MFRLCFFLQFAEQEWMEYVWLVAGLSVGLGVSGVIGYLIGQKCGDAKRGALFGLALGPIGWLLTIFANDPRPKCRRCGIPLKNSSRCSKCGNKPQSIAAVRGSPVDPVVAWSKAQNEAEARKNETTPPA
jgi:hypothetical protein